MSSRFEKGFETDTEASRTGDLLRQVFPDRRGPAFYVVLHSERSTATDPACSLAPKHHVIEAAVLEANSENGIAKPTTASSFVQLQQQNATLWNYRTNPE